MHLSGQIHDDIYILVFRHILWNTGATQSVFKRNLKLLSICQKWRQLAMPLMYKTVFIANNQRHCEEAGLHCRNMSEVHNNELISNLHLINSAGCLNAIRSIQIDVYYRLNLFPELLKVVNLLGRVSHYLKAKCLQLSIHPQDNNFDIIPEEHMSELHNAGCAIVNTLPNIQELYFCGNSSNKVAQILYGLISEHYSLQLKVLKTNHAIAVLKDCVFKKLEIVSINVDNINNYKIPFMLADNLKSLTLYNTPSTHSWDSFKTSKDAKFIEFSNLKQLKLTYNDTNALHKNLSCLKFPSLKYLNVYSESEECWLFESGIFPNNISHIHIEATAPIFAYISKHLNFSTNTIELCAGSVETASSETLYNINQILCKTTNNKKAAILVKGEGEFFADYITSTLLTDIDITSIISVKTMLSLLDRLPNLTNMVLRNINLDNAQEDITIPNIDEHIHNSMTPFKNKLQLTQLGYIKNKHSHVLIIPVILYLLLKSPKLQMLISRKTLQKSVFNELNKFIPLYPHLNNVKFQLHMDTVWGSVV